MFSFSRTDLSYDYMWSRRYLDESSSCESAFYASLSLFVLDGVTEFGLGRTGDEMLSLSGYFIFV